MLLLRPLLLWRLLTMVSLSFLPSNLQTVHRLSRTNSSGRRHQLLVIDWYLKSRHLLLSLLWIIWHLAVLLNLSLTLTILDPSSALYRKFWTHLTCEMCLGTRRN